MRDAVLRRAFLPAHLRETLLVQGLEVDLGQVHRREATALDHVGHVAAQVRVDDLRAGNAEDGAHLLIRQIADFEAMWPGRPIIKLPDAGHFSQEDVPDTIVALIQQFIQST